MLPFFSESFSSLRLVCICQDNGCATGTRVVRALAVCGGTGVTLCGTGAPASCGVGVPLPLFPSALPSPVPLGGDATYHRKTSFIVMFPSSLTPHSPLIAVPPLPSSFDFFKGLVRKKIY